MHSWVEEPSVDDGRTIVIYECSNREGSTFALSPASRRKLVETFGAKLHVVPRIFVAHDPYKHDRLHGSLVKSLIALLTGLEDEQLVKIEDIVFWDPVTDQRLNESMVAD